MPQYRVLRCCTFALLGLPSVIGHSRWTCPAARDRNDPQGHHIKFDNTGNKYGACGPLSGQYGVEGVTELSPGPLTVEWEESIAHAGSPFRIAILDEHENEQAILLDHIPHWDAAAPVPYLESTYVPYRITVNIPDIRCNKCSLQLIYFMTDKSTKCGMKICTYRPEDSACSGHLDASQEKCFGAPNDMPCERANTCFSNYHSCADVRINGQHRLEDLELDQQPKEWPYRKLGLNQYGSEAAEWEDGWLKGLPRKFVEPAGDVCMPNA